MCENEQKAEPKPSKTRAPEPQSSAATFMKTKSSGAGAMFMKIRAPGPELGHFYDGSAALLTAFSLFLCCGLTI